MRRLIPYLLFLTIMVVVKNFKDARFTIVQGQIGDSSKHIARKSRLGQEDSNSRTMRFKGLIPPQIIGCKIQAQFAQFFNGRISSLKIPTSRQVIGIQH